ncbi:conserved hypothetical protein [Carnobacterium maltaromaticum]|nr:conserved hypothetical protein [Carnobacterium maltaromaticum]
MSQSFGKKINSQKSKEPLFLEFPIFLPGLTGSTNFLSRLVLMSQLLEKKIKIREDKKRPINFSYFLAGANRLNKLFIKGVILCRKRICGQIQINCYYKLGRMRKLQWGNCAFFLGMLLE